MSKTRSVVNGIHIRKPSRKLRMNQMAGVSNDFISKKDIKLYGSLAHKREYLRRKKREENFAKLCSDQDKELEKQIYIEHRFPPIVESKTKNYLSYRKTCEKRVEKLRKTEKFFPRKYSEDLNCVGKLVKIQPCFEYSTGFYMYFVESHIMSDWSSKNPEDAAKKFPIITSKAKHFNKDVMIEIIAMTTGRIIVELNLKTGKPDEILAREVLIEDKLIYICANQLVRF